MVFFFISRDGKPLLTICRYTLARKHNSLFKITYKSKVLTPTLPSRVSTLSRGSCSQRQKHHQPTRSPERAITQQTIAGRVAGRPRPRRQKVNREPECSSSSSSPPKKDAHVQAAGRTKGRRLVVACACAAARASQMAETARRAAHYYRSCCPSAPRSRFLYVGYAQSWCPLFVLARRCLRCCLFFCCLLGWGGFWGGGFWPKLQCWGIVT